MDKEPKPPDTTSATRPEIFDDEYFIGSVHATETTLNKTERSQLEQQAFVDTSIEVLNEHLGTEYVDDQVNIIGYGYLADAKGRLLVDASGAAEQVCIDCGEVNYSGIDIIKIPSQGKTAESYKVVCRFKNPNYDEDGRSHTEILYVPPEDVLEFTPSYPCESESLKTLLMKFADISEAVTKNHTFTLANGHEQRRILKQLSYQIGRYVMASYENETVAANTSEFFVVTLTKEGKKPIISLVDQYNLPPQKWSTPTGKVLGCTFIESLNKEIVKIRALVRQYPCIVISNDDSEDSFYLIPIRAFNFADVIDDK